MHAATRRTAEGLAVVGGVVLLRPGTRANRAAQRYAEALARHLRHFAGRLHGASYRLRGRHPDPNVSGNLLADRIRSSLGPLEKRLDLPHIHLMAEDQIVLLHGEVGTAAEADELESAVAEVSGVLGVEAPPPPDRSGHRRRAQRPSRLHARSRLTHVDQPERQGAHAPRRAVTGSGSSAIVRAWR